MKKTLNGWKKLKIMFLEKSGTNRFFFLGLAIDK